jgi:uncharacterized protein (DUF58 family)
VNTDSLRSAKLMALMAATSFILCSGVMTGNRQLYWMASLLGVLMGGVYLLVRWQTPRVKASRQLPAEVWEGEPFEVHLQVSLPARFVPLLYRVRDQVAPALQAQDAPLIVLPSQSRTVSYRVIPLRRGEHGIGPLELWVSDLLGLFEVQRIVPLTHQVLVLPRPVPLPNRVWEGGGRGRAHQVSSRSALKGEGTDWHGTREYTPGDPLRRINWRATARHQSWHVHQFETSHLAPLIVALELAPRWHQEPNGTCPDFERAIRHITWLVMEAPRSGIQLYLTGPGWEGVWVENASREGVMQAVRALARIQPRAHLSLAQQLPTLVQQYGEQFLLCLFVPPAERRHYETLIQPYLQQGYSLQIYA